MQRQFSHTWTVFSELHDQLLARLERHGMRIADALFLYRS